MWIETEDAATVVVQAGGHRAAARTFAVHGHHYALLLLEGLQPGGKSEYTVDVDGVRVWPAADARYGPSVIATLQPGKPLRLAFGSCRVSVPHDADHHAKFGVDALRAYALRMAGQTVDEDGPQPDERWPDLLLFLGDQVYADETSGEMQAFIAARRSLDEPPGKELKDFVEYAELYRIAWSDPANRWLLSTLPSAMIFDDHDIRDDWNTSLAWRRKIEATSWWHDRVVGGLASYWVYQHIGNLSPAELRTDPLFGLVLEHEASGADPELDLTADVERLAARADREPDCYRWSFSRDFDTQARLIVVDSRAARVLRPDCRSILDDAEMAWLDDRMRGDVDHLLIGTSLPFLLAPALHHLESVGEAVAEGAWGKPLARLGEVMRDLADLEHWAAFERGFVRVGRMVLEVASGRRGRPPGTIAFLSGDVHHSYVAEAWPLPDDNSRATADGAAAGAGTRILQAVCSPIRNPLPGVMRAATALGARGRARPTGRLVGGKVPRSPLWWRVVEGPWYDNNLAVLETAPDRLHLWWSTGEVVDGDADRLALRRVADIDVWARPRSVP